MKLATEIAVTSSAQVGLLVLPIVALASFAFAHPVALSFRPYELLAIALATVAGALVVWDGTSRRWEGAALIGIYGGLAVGFLFVGDR